jgi:hypothetical protein
MDIKSIEAFKKITEDLGKTLGIQQNIVGLTQLNQE